MSTTPPEQPAETDDDRLNTALVAFAACVGEATDVCSYGLTIGDSYVPFDPDDEENCDGDDPANDPKCSQVWVRVAGVTPFGQVDAYGGDVCSVDLRLELEVGILRCFGIEEDGAAPSTTDVLIAATQAMSDMLAIKCAALSCDVWESISLGTWVPQGPLGGQVGGTWTFTVEF